MQHAHTEKWAQMPLTRLHAVPTIVVLMITIGYSFTMSPHDGFNNVLRHLGYDPSGFGLDELLA